MPSDFPAPSEITLPVHHKLFEITAETIRDSAPPKEIPLTKYIHVSPNTIRDNWTAEQEGRPQDIKPAIVVGFADQKINAYHVDILGPSRMIQNQKGLANGARVWIETEAEIDIFTTRKDIPDGQEAEVPR